MILFNGTRFTTREINLPQFGLVVICTMALNKMLFDDLGAYVSDEAFLIDESIFLFVNDNEIDIPEDELKTLILSTVKG